MVLAAAECTENHTIGSMHSSTLFFIPMPLAQANLRCFFVALVLSPLYWPKQLHCFASPSVARRFLRRTKCEPFAPFSIVSASYFIGLKSRSKVYQERKDRLDVVRPTPVFESTSTCAFCRTKPPTDDWQEHTHKYVLLLS